MQKGEESMHACINAIATGTCRMNQQWQKLHGGQGDRHRPSLDAQCSFSTPCMHACIYIGWYPQFNKF